MVGSTGQSNNKLGKPPRKLLITGKLKQNRPGKLVEKVCEFLEE
jgi:hypothetical protein